MDHGLSQVPSASKLMVSTSHNWAALRGQTPDRSRAQSSLKGGPLALSHEQEVGLGMMGHPTVAPRGPPSTQGSPEQGGLGSLSPTRNPPAPWPPSPSTWLPPSGSSVLLGLCCCLQQVGWDCSQSRDQLTSLSRCLRAPQKGSLRRTWLICLESFRDPGPDWRKLLSSPRPGERAWQTLIA